MSANKLNFYEALKKWSQEGKLEKVIFVYSDLDKLEQTAEEYGRNLKALLVEGMHREHRPIIKRELGVDERMICSRCNKYFDPPHDDYSGYCSDCIETTYIELNKLRDQREESK